MADNDEPSRKKRKEMSTDERMCCFTMMFSDSKDGRPKRGSIGELAHFFDVERSTISRLWRTIHSKLQQHVVDNGPDASLSFLLERDNFHNGAKGKRSRPRKWDRDGMKAAAKEVPLSLCKKF